VPPPMQDLGLTCPFHTEEKWDQDSRLDLPSSDGSESELCTARNAFRSRYGCSPHSSSDARALCLQRTPGSMASCSWDPSSLENEQGSQNGRSTQKKRQRPSKAKRRRFRRFVDDLKEKISNEGDKFNLACPYFSQKTQDRIKMILSSHCEELHKRRLFAQLLSEESPELDQLTLDVYYLSL